MQPVDNNPVTDLFEPPSKKAKKEITSEFNGRNIRTLETCELTSVFTKAATTKAPWLQSAYDELQSRISTEKLDLPKIREIHKTAKAAGLKTPKIPVKLKGLHDAEVDAFLFTNVSESPNRLKSGTWTSNENELQLTLNAFAALNNYIKNNVTDISSLSLSEKLELFDFIVMHMVKVPDLREVLLNEEDVINQIDPIKLATLAHQTQIPSLIPYCCKVLNNSIVMDEGEIFSSGMKSKWENRPTLPGVIPLNLPSEIGSIEQEDPPSLANVLKSIAETGIKFSVSLTSENINSFLYLTKELKGTITCIEIADSEIQDGRINRTLLNPLVGSYPDVKSLILPKECEIDKLKNKFPNVSDLNYKKTYLFIPKLFETFPNLITLTCQGTFEWRTTNKGDLREVKICSNGWEDLGAWFFAVQDNNTLEKIEIQTFYGPALNNLLKENTHVKSFIIDDFGTTPLNDERLEQIGFYFPNLKELSIEKADFTYTAKAMQDFKNKHPDIVITFNRQLI